MSQFTECAFNGSTVVLDGNKYIGCNFTKCRIVITRGNFILKDSNFDSCTFEFGGEAAIIRSLVLGLINQPKQSKENHTSNKEAQ